ncbi:AAA family ATPase [Cytobacillus oceanisediminis]|uniref:AAA family ATPase n=1 Tax=Cytobacillus oceanisediminis TaxID=665099 RepID=UPI00203D278D|nr:AAA family ATPase [Cytobacillus oceanisediminis]MCM3246535.1 AAA family ATPase [Cytobacillus oceanisediminis]
MKLLYFWFKEYKQLNEFEANLGSKFIFKFNKSNEYNLSIFENKTYIENFFTLPLDKNRTEETPIDISAIVGENGSGKSTVLDFLSELMSKNNIDTDFVLVYSIENNLHIFSTFQSKISFENNTSQAIYFCISPLNLKKHLSILFSNVFDARSIGMLSEEEKIYFKNITTNYLISRDSDISHFLRSEFEKQIFFIHEYKEQLNIQNLMKIPNKIYIEVSLDEEDIVFTDELEEVDYFLRDGALDFFNFSINNKFFTEFYSNCLRSYFIHIDLLLKEYQLPTSYNYRDYLYRFSLSRHKNIFDGIYKQILNDTSNKNKKKDFLDRIFELKEDFKKISKYFMEMKFHDENNTPYIETDSLDTRKFITLYQKAFSKVGCLKFTWSDMSSGEYGMLSLFSRFHHILKVLKTEQELFGDDGDDENLTKGWFMKNGELEFPENSASFPSSYLLLIDEGDLYFHPQWQKDWLYYFIRLSELLFKGEVQIILTTHSPFVLSDFPNTNVIFLRNTQELVSHSFLEGSPKTFASNIIELFSNSFFIKDGLIGSFAKEKINHFILELLKLTPEEVYLEKDKYKKFIDTIGEPLIRNKVLQIYQGKLELHTETDISRRILFLEQELKELKDKGKISR